VVRVPQTVVDPELLSQLWLVVLHSLQIGQEPDTTPLQPVHDPIPQAPLEQLPEQLEQF